VGPTVYESTAIPRVVSGASPINDQGFDAPRPSS
jgi:hypothetical protein